MTDDHAKKLWVDAWRSGDPDGNDRVIRFSKLIIAELRQDSDRIEDAVNVLRAGLRLEANDV